MTSSNVYLRCAAAVVAMYWSAAAASAATSITNSLTGFTGDSTQVATQNAVMAAGFNFAEFGDANTKVSFDSSGAKFGPVLGTTPDDGNAQRNYMRTNDDDYSDVSFVAEVTIATTADIDLQDAYVGLGSGNVVTDNFRLPDFGTDVASVMYWGENEPDTPTMEVGTTNDNTSNFVNVPAPGLLAGTHRLRMNVDWFRKTSEFSLDVNYAGGPFTADVTQTVSTMPLYATGTGFHVEPGRIFFGGDQTTTFKDFQVTVSGSPVTYGDFNNNGTITSADWMILRANLYADVSGSHSDAYFLGDLTADLAINQADFVAFKTLYETFNGAGSFAQMLAGVPEPATLVLIVSAGLMTVPIRRRAAIRT